jgi:acetylornithine/N-succinyldiaminopimelate aminotransferase
MALMTTYNPLPVTFTHGKGVWLYDESGHAYLDGLSGIGVCSLGHAHPDVTHTIQQQAGRLLHTSNTYHIQAQEQLAKRLTRMSGMEQVFFANSGAEANEAAIKLARLFGHKKGIESPAIIVMSGAFHGRTLATLSASAGRKVQAGFEPLVPGFIRAPFNDLEAIHTIASSREDVVAVMLEPIQGEGGIIVADESYMHAVAALCKENDWLFICDEIQSGMGRTGHLYACTGLGIQPDVITTAKALANGVPIGACLMSNRACDLFKPGSHGSTFGGNALACATALTVLEVMERDHIIEHAMTAGLQLNTRLIETLGGHPNVRGIRGKGLMIGIELDRPALEMRRIGLDNRLLFSVTAESVIRLLPPLIIQPNEIEELVSRLVKTIHTFFATQ